jgi:hypothetical protein
MISDHLMIRISPVILKAEAAISQILEVLKVYSKYRYSEQHSSLPKYVGQFIDTEGAKDAQFGIYGTSMFLVMSAHSDSEHFLSLKRQCKEILKKYVVASDYNLEIRDLSGVPGYFKKESGEIVSAEESWLNSKSEVYEMKFVTSKACYALQALLLYPDCVTESEIMENAILKSQKEGGWGYLLQDSYCSNIASTSLVLRSLKPRSRNKQAINEALQFIINNYSKEPNLFIQLYALNGVTAVLKSNADFQREFQFDYSGGLRKVIKQLYYAVKNNPTKFANPINIDFGDPIAGRTRYYRVSSNLVLLESLFNLSRSFHYLYIYTGKKVMNDLLGNIDQKALYVNDTSDHRASFGFYFSSFNILCSITQSKRVKRWIWFDKQWGKAQHAWYFGVDLRPQFVIFLASVVVFPIAFYYINGEDRRYVYTALFGIAVKLVADIITIWYTEKQNKKYI